MPRSNSIGLKTLLIHIVIASVGWILLDTKPDGYQIVVFAIVSATIIVIWQKAVKNACKDGFLNSVIVSLYFIIPSILLGAAYYYSSLHPLQTNLVYIDLGWSIFNYPLSPGIFQSDADIGLKVFMPVVLMGILVFGNYTDSKWPKSRNIILILLFIALIVSFIWANVAK